MGRKYRHRGAVTGPRWCKYAQTFFSVVATVAVRLVLQLRLNLMKCSYPSPTFLAWNCRKQPSISSFFGIYAPVVLLNVGKQLSWSRSEERRVGESGEGWRRS